MEGSDNPPVFAQEFTFTPRKAGPQWAEVEVQAPDGRPVVVGISTLIAYKYTPARRALHLKKLEKV